MPGGGAPPPGPAMPPRRWEAAEPQHQPQASAAHRELDGASSRGGAGGGPSTAVTAAAGASASLPAAVRSALELADARRRLLEAESRRQLVSELESRVHQLHRVFLEAELRLAHRAETVGRMGSGVAQAELHLTSHGQRLKKTLRRSKKLRPPALLASALALSGCVPWAGGQARRGGGRAGAPDTPESPFRRSAPAAAASVPPVQRP